MEEIDQLLSKWKGQKSLLGIRTSDVELRIEQLLDILKNERERRDRYQSDMELFRGKLDGVRVATTKDVVRKRAMEDVVIKRDELFDKENELFSQLKILKELYQKIKDYEFEGKSAPQNSYTHFQEIMTNCEYLDELIETKRNYIHNNFETASQEAFLKFFTENGKNLIYDVETLKGVIKRSAVNIDNLKGDLRNQPRKLQTDKDLEDAMRVDKTSKNYQLDDVVLKTTLQGENAMEQSMILRKIRRNIEDYGLDLGMKKSNSALIPRAVVNQRYNSGFI